ncbi:DUF3551 domain-containing protein [Variibacter gotjawalensis]|uniref:DUF3551 domain-containing protein n=1 Tax=Variibacter gotjawalensis TaxID=1333996 RepID=UPI0010D04469|nr:uncharacterized protein DUF3551 [Variibacter gotjawalensis]
MRWVAAVALLLAGISAASAQSVASRYPWCMGIQSSEQGQSISCPFSTFEECRAEASLNRGWCFPNPRYVAQAPETAPQSQPEPPPGAPTKRRR